MKIYELEIENFRQYYGKHRIVFSSTQKNVTVILGENGKGKTGIFRAIVFCLFGSEYLEQDIEGKQIPKKMSEKLHLVNLNKLDENEGEPIKAVVSMKLSHKEKTYEITRTITEMKTKNRYEKENDSRVKLSIIDENGNLAEVIEEKNRSKIIIDEIMNEELKGFFLFDGEKIKHLSGTSEKARKDIKRGIMKLLQIDKLEEAIRIIQNLKREQKDKTKDSTNTKLVFEQNNLDKIKKDKENFEKEKEIMSENLEKLKEEFEECENTLKENKEIKDLFSERDNKKTLKQEKIKQLDSLKMKMKEMLKDSAHLIMMEEYIIKAKNYIETEIVEKNYKTNISVEMIEDILSRKECICGNKFEVNESEWNILNKLKLDIKKSSLSVFIHDLQRNMNDFFENKQKYKNEIEELLLNRSEMESEIEELSKLIEKYERKIKESSQNENNLKSKEEKRNKMKAEIDKFSLDIRVRQKNIEDKEHEIVEKENLVRELIEKDEKLRIEGKKLKYIEELEKSFIYILEKYGTKMREKLSEETTKIIKELISEKDKNIIKKIEIGNNYEINAIGWNDAPIISDISAGQSQIVSLSFVTALARIAAGGQKKINMPLFMDTPFGNISGENRDNLIMKLPELTSQLILLVTDTEFAKNEVAQMKETEKWGMFYELIQEKEGIAKVEEIKDIDGYLARR